MHDYLSIPSLKYVYVCVRAHAFIIYVVCKGLFFSSCPTCGAGNPRCIGSLMLTDFAVWYLNKKWLSLSFINDVFLSSFLCPTRTSRLIMCMKKDSLSVCGYILFFVSSKLCSLSFSLIYCNHPSS